MACEVDTDEGAEGVRVDAVVAVTHDGPVDVPGDDQGRRVSCVAERLLHTGGVEQAEGDVERFAEASVAVVVDFSRMYDDADAELLVSLTFGLLFIGGVIADCWLLWDKDKQELWDKIAGTVVVNDPEKLLIPSAQAS